MYFLNSFSWISKITQNARLQYCWLVKRDITLSQWSLLKKKQSFLLQKIFQLTNYIKYIYQINFIKCIFKKIKLCWQAKIVNFFLYTKQTLFNSSLYSFPLMAYHNNILTSQNTLKPNLLKWPSIHCTIVLMASVVSKCIRQ